jgi:hypothetical protein
LALSDDSCRTWEVDPILGSGGGGGLIYDASTAERHQDRIVVFAGRGDEESASWFNRAVMELGDNPLQAFAEGSLPLGAAGSQAFCVVRPDGQYILVYSDPSKSWHVAGIKAVALNGQRGDFNDLPSVPAGPFDTAAIFFYHGRLGFLGFDGGTWFVQVSDTGPTGLQEPFGKLTTVIFPPGSFPGGVAPAASGAARARVDGDIEFAVMGDDGSWRIMRCAGLSLDGEGDWFKTGE